MHPALASPGHEEGEAEHQVGGEQEEPGPGLGGGVGGEYGMLGG